jgi:DnaJ-domain-containing protein 1
MSDKMALQLAIDLLHVPSQVRFVRSAPLPGGISMLLRIVAGDEEAELRAAALTDRSRDIVRQAATFFIEQILLAPYTDSYRVLGASPQADAVELRRNLALLSKWLHPDRNTHNDRSIFMDRVTAAWNDLKTPERRAMYDAMYDQVRRRATNARKSRSNVRKKQLTAHKQNIIARYRAARSKAVRRRHAGQMVGLIRLVLSVLFRRPRP